MKESDVTSFLRDFKVKKNTWGVFYMDNRNKNTQALLELELQPIKRDEFLQSLSSEDYAKGPVSDEVFYGQPLWVFGKLIKGQEVYIKISMGQPNTRVICISFHKSEFKLVYPYKKNNDEKSNYWQRNDSCQGEKVC